MSRRRVALSLSLMVVTAMLSGPAHASCAGPGLSVSPAQAVAGSTVTVSGRYLFDGCDDTGGGCSGQPDPSHPLRPRTLEIVTSAGSVELGEFNPDNAGARTKQVVIPVDLRGPVTLRLLTKHGDEYAATQLLVLSPSPTSAGPK
jgi:hypothetical protein